MLESVDHPDITNMLDSNSQEISNSAAEKQRKAKSKAKIAIEHVDIIKDEFWNHRPWILAGTAGRPK
jgi:tRNA(His) guanylyltransferase